jgi:hypothetical protein
VDPVLDPQLLRKSGSAGNRTRTPGSVARNSDHWTTEGVVVYIFFVAIFMFWQSCNGEHAFPYMFHIHLLIEECWLTETNMYVYLCHLLRWFILKVVVKKRMKKIHPYIKLSSHQTVKMSDLRKVSE